MRVLALLVCPLAAVTLLTGCEPKELKTASQASEFIDDLARGGSIDDWTHELDAVAFADSAWYNGDEIERLGTRIREEGADWACNTAGGADTVSELVEAIRSPEAAERASIFESAEEAGGDEYEIESLFEEVLDLGGSEAVETIGSACDAAEGF